MSFSCRVVRRSKPAKAVGPSIRRKRFALDSSASNFNSSALKLSRLQDQWTYLRDSRVSRGRTAAMVDASCKVGSIA